VSGPVDGSWIGRERGDSAACAAPIALSAVSWLGEA